MADVLQLDATAQLQWLQSGRIGAVELLDLALARQAKTAERLNAVVRIDPDHARDRAAATDERRLLARRRGDDPEAIGLLAGLPMTVKDVYDVEGMPASSGLAAYLDRKAPDADVVARVRAAGAVVWGKTNTPVLAGDWQTFNRLYGTTNNPWDSSRTPGGSSGGSAAALAAGITALEIGGDIGGSLRVPASFCGVHAHKPTYGLVSLRGSVPPAPGRRLVYDLGVAGPMARSARDLRLLLSVLAPAALPARAPPPRLAELRIGLWVEAAGFPLDDAVRDVVAGFASELAGAGAQVSVIAAPVDAEALLAAYVVLLLSITGAEAKPGARLAMEALRGPAAAARALGVSGALSWPSLVRAATARHRDWLAADEVRERLRAEAAETFAEVDLILAPCAPTTAPRHDHRPLIARRLRTSDGRSHSALTMLCWPALATVLGLPATAIPAGMAKDGLPVGVQLIGRAGEDSRVLAAAQAIEEALGGFAPPPSQGAAGLSSR